ncbi:MAG TPA: hypothetical protein VLX68_09150 [Chitinivibrionales bacterium]|nr:hypothetical protein [Chitinivibrionales bacterium]
MKYLAYILQILIVCLLAPVAGQPSGSSVKGDTNQKQHAASDIFNEIMQSLPADMKAKVDSAAADVKADAKAQQKNQSSESQSSKGTGADSRDGAVNKLPAEMRDKVEKAISDMDLMNQNRQIQFKEYEKKRLGGK